MKPSKTLDFPDSMTEETVAETLVFLSTAEEHQRKNLQKLWRSSVVLTDPQTLSVLNSLFVLS